MALYVSPIPSITTINPSVKGAVPTETIECKRQREKQESEEDNVSAREKRKNEDKLDVKLKISTGALLNAKEKHKLIIFLQIIKSNSDSDASDVIRNNHIENTANFTWKHHI